MKQLQLIADDLTGALDTAVQFVTPGHPLPVFLSGRLPGVVPGSFAIDSGSRERDAAHAAAAASHHAGFFGADPGVIAFKKVDSLLRGHPGLELAATLGVMKPAHCVIAPAFPFHRRVTRDGRQWAFLEGAWQRVGDDLCASLSLHGISVQRRKPGDPVPYGVSLWDAETDLELDSIAQAGARLSGRLLWCGSGGLAAALAGAEAPAAPGLDRPVLGLFGSDHPATAAQLSACAEHVLAVRGNEAAVLSARLADHGVCLVRFALAPGTERRAASDAIALGLAELTARLPPPRGLFVSGGETLRALCATVGAERLDLLGQLMPGVPVSVMVGGRWDGVRVASKSGSFGDGALLRRLLALDAQS
jgi:uncharacterized protein YgbK (DUF1537 family)